MAPEILATPDLRVDAVRELLESAQQAGGAHLTGLSVLDLCALGAPRHAYFSAHMSRAWDKLGEKAQREFVEASTNRLVQHGDLLDSGEGPGFLLSPQLGIVLAARCRPGFVITVEIAGVPLHGPAAFALSDETEGLRGIVVETPAGGTKGRKIKWLSLPPALDMAYAYELFTPGQAANFLARYAMMPVPRRRDVRPGTPRLVTRFQPQDASGSVGHRISVLGNGTTARVDTGDGGPARELGLAELTALIQDLIGGRLGGR